MDALELLLNKYLIHMRIESEALMTIYRSSGTGVHTQTSFHGKILTLKLLIMISLYLE